MTDMPGADHAHFNPNLPSEPGPVAAPQEDVVRGTIFAAAAIPLGIILWLVIWNFGFVASLVAWIVAAAAAKLYAVGAGNPSRRGVWAILVVTVVTLVLAFIGGMWLDMVRQFGANPMEALVDGESWSTFGDNLANNPELWKEYTGSILSALLFGALGCFFTLRKLFTTTASA